MIIGVIAMIGIILFFALIFWALDIAMQEFHQPYFNYVITDGKKSKAKRVFKKMLMDENRYCHYKYNDTEV